MWFADSDEQADRILGVLHDGGASAYFGESVTQLDHALQTAALAEAANASTALVVAALLHDVGHLLPADSVAPANSVDHPGHDDVGHRWLTRFFGTAVTEPIRLHVAAKRYLCAVEPGYAALLSAASQASLSRQGGPMAAEEVRDFMNAPWAVEAVILRRWDDVAKAPGLTVPGLPHYRKRIKQLIEDR